MLRRQKSFAVVGKSDPNRWSVAGAKKADALFSEHAKQPADLESCSLQNCMQTIAFLFLELMPVQPVVRFQVADDRLERFLRFVKNLLQAPKKT